MALKIIAGTATVAGGASIYDILARNEPYMRIRAAPQSFEGVPKSQWPPQRMIVEAYSSNILGAPLKTTKISHGGLKGFYPQDGGFIGTKRWILRSESNPTILSSQPPDPLFEFTPANPLQNAEELPNYFMADLMGHPVKTEIIYIDHWGVQQKKVFDWAEIVTG